MTSAKREWSATQREHLLLAGRLLNAARQRTAPSGFITTWIEHLEMPLRPVGQVPGYFHGALASGLDQIVRDQFFD